jgi:hypothetical protein
MERLGGTVEVVECEDGSLVERIQDSLHLQFPQSIKSFYAIYEYLQVDIHEFTWIRSFEEVIGRLRSRHPEIPSNYLPVLDDGVGGHYYVVCSDGGRESPRDFGAVIYNPAGVLNVMEFTSSDFIDFVTSRVEDGLDDIE